MSILGVESRVKSSAIWSLLGNVSGQLIRFGSNLILTRLLFPGDFGLMALVQTLMVTLTLLSDVGISQTFVYHKRAEELHFKRALWTLQVVRGMVLWFAAVLVACALYLCGHFGWISSDSTYGDPRLPIVVIVSTFQLVIQALSSSKAHIAHRTLQQRELIILGFFSQLVSVFVMLAWAYAWPSIWALVMGGLVAALFSTLLSHVYLAGDSDRVVWDPKVTRELMRAGGWVFVSTMAGFLASLGDRFIVGGIFDPATFGLYAIACLLISPCQIIFNTLIISVAFPAFGEVHRSNPAELRLVYRKFQRNADVFLGTAAGFLMFAGEIIVETFYDSRFHGAGWMLSLIAAGLIGARSLVVEQVFSSMGNFKLNAMSNLIKLAALVLALPVFNHYWGFKGCLLATVCASFASWPLLYQLRIRLGIGGINDDVWIAPAVIFGASLALLAEVVLSSFMSF